MSLLLVAAMPLITLALMGVVLLVMGSLDDVHPVAICAALALGVVVGWGTWIQVLQGDELPAPVSSVVLP